MRNLFTANNVELTEEIELRVVPALLESSKELVSELLMRGHLLPGVGAALERLSGDESIVQSALTGNLRPNADNKLKLLGKLVQYLDLEVGGYGSDDIVRSNLVAVAQRRATEKYGTAFDEASTILIGDTPRDVAAATKGGARIIAVATGVYSEDDLREAGAHAVLTDLSDFDVLRQALNTVGDLSVQA
jgi:phosphoglycolate phosphatase-like HAD superfamily hydrolase